MKLSLKHHNQPLQQANAAFIRGNTPEKWLSDISRWGIPAKELACYALPESVRNPTLSGLLVIFKHAVDMGKKDVLEPYYSVGEKLFLPFNHQLFPEVNEAELKTILVWDVQVFHPTIGLVGFTKQDKIDLKNLLISPKIEENKWQEAQVGNPFRPLLTEISVVNSLPEEVMEELKQGIEKKPLSNIPKDEEERSELSKLLDDAKRGILKGTMSALDKLDNLLPNTEGGNSQSGAMNQFYEWLKNNLDVLEKRRNDEIQRLLNLFENDPDEALKYALPLDSPYLSRGEAKPSTTLGRRSTNFSTGNLGGGYSVDGWDLGDNYFNLQTKYRNAAKSATDNKDFKKAAYIYANLLGDYDSAAKVLEEGKFYKEAAVLYKDHLKNQAAAAECLEKGGLTLQAIEIYDELQRYEKVGDLYQKIEQPAKAKRYYEETAKTYLGSGDYLEAARLEKEKLLENDRAQATLLRGWEESNQAEGCLKKYFDNAAKTDEKALPQAVERTFDSEMPFPKKERFLNVLGYLVDKNSDKQLEETARHIAYEIVGEQLAKGNAVQAYNLKRFIPNDALIGSDISRFVQANKSIKKTNTGLDDYQLDKTIRWLSAICHRNYYLAVGEKLDDLILVRGNWYGKMEYHVWAKQGSGLEGVHFIFNQHASEHIFLYTYPKKDLSIKTLLKDKHFFENRLIISSPHWMPENAFAATMLYNGNLLFLDEPHTYKFFSKEYNVQGRLIDTKIHQKEKKEELFAMPNRFAEMIHKHNFYYTCVANVISKIPADSGTIESFVADSDILKLVGATEYHTFRLVASTYEGCFLLKPELTDFDDYLIYFAKDLQPVDMCFVAEDKLVIADKYVSHVYSINDTTANLDKVLETPNHKTVSILKTKDRNRFALLSEDGLIRFYEI